MPDQCHLAASFRRRVKREPSLSKLTTNETLSKPRCEGLLRLNNLNLRRAVLGNRKELDGVIANLCGWLCGG